MANSSRTSGMGHISPADFQAMMAGTKTLPLSSSSSSTATSLGTPKLSIVTQHKRSSTDPTAVLSAADKAAIHRAIEDLKQLQESTKYASIIAFQRSETYTCILLKHLLTHTL